METSGHTLSPAHILPALKTLVFRHDALRAKVTPGDRSTNQIPFFSSDEPQFENFENLSVKNFKGSMKWAVKVIRGKFGLSSRLFRFRFLQSSPKKLAVCLAFHHIAVDGASIHILLTEFFSLLAGNSLPPHPPQITSFLPSLGDVTGQSSDDVKRERNKRKWVSLMGSMLKCPRISLPEQGLEPVCTKHSEWIAIKCPSCVTDMVNEIASFYKVSQTVVLTAVFTIAVRQELLSSEEAVVIGCASANRRRPQKDMVGHTVNLLPLKVDFPTDGAPINLSPIIFQIKAGWSLIMEGGISLIDLLPVLPCLRNRDSRPIGNQDRVYSSSPLQIIFSFLPTPQKPLLKSFTLGKQNEVCCRVNFPRSCDAQADLFLEVRAPGNWEGNEAESCFLFTWEFRSAALSREKIEQLHNFTLGVVTSCQCITQNMKSGEANDVIQFPGTTENIGVPENMILSSYRFAKKEEKMESYMEREIFLHSARGVWVWPDQHSTSSSSYARPKPLQDPLEISLVQGVTVNTAHLTPIEMFLQTAGRVPSNVAFRYGTQTLTYAQATVEIERLAKILRWKGVVPGNHVGLVMPPCTDLYISLLAILRCGGAYVPLSLHHPQSTLLIMLETADCKLLLTDTATLSQKLPDYHGGYICLDHDTITPDDVTQLPPEDGVYSQDLVAYIIFTSGTTGTPKGVAITNESLSHFLSNFKLVATPHDTEITLAGCTVAWDGHVLDSLGPLHNGSCLVIGPTLEISEGITFAFMSPSAASVLQFPKSMRCLMVGGETFTRTCFKNVKNIPKVISVYGPTETTVFVSAMYVDTTTTSDASEVFSNLGKAMPGVSLMVCDSQLQPVELGSEGELCIAGPQVSKVGYYKNPTKTKQSFVQSPLSGYGTVYCTGDWTKMLCDGTIVFLGRTDDQVKLRGMRFQLHEVENALRRHPEVKMAAVAVRNQGTASAQLVGFVTPKEIELEPLFKFLQGSLPSYMVPSAIATLDSLPLKNEGKVDRRALLHTTAPQQSREAGEMDAKREGATVKENCGTTKEETGIKAESCGQNEGGTGTAPKLQESEVAERLASIFGQVLGLESYPVDADFFRSGGQSLLLFRLLQMVNSEMDTTLSLSDLLQSFQNLSPLSLASSIVESAAEGQCAAKEGCTTSTSSTKSLGTEATTEAKVTESNTKPSALDEIAEQLASIFGQIFGLQSYPAHVEFFRSGIQSLLLFRLLQMVNSELDMTLSLSDVLQSFQNLSPLSLASSIEESTTEGQRAATSNTLAATSLADFDYLEPVTAPVTLNFLEQLLTRGTGLSTKERSTALQKETGILIPPSSLVRYPNTFALQTQLKLKRLIEYFDATKSPVVRLQQSTLGEQDTPIVFIHGGIIGWPLPYISLARSLPCSSIAVQRCEESPTSSFEEMVGFYVKAILCAQPCGPYRLVGVCYGAMMVYKVARQLTDEGHSVELAVFVNHSPAIEKKPEIFDSEGEPLAGTFVDPIVFFRKILGLPLEGVEDGGGMGKEEGQTGNKRLEARVKRVVHSILSSPESSWIPFTAAELESVYFSFFRRLRCAWRGYTPRPGAAINHALLIRNATHPLFASHDFGLASLLPSDAQLTVAVAPQQMGLMSDPRTLKFVTAQIVSCLTIPNSP